MAQKRVANDRSFISRTQQSPDKITSHHSTKQPFKIESDPNHPAKVVAQHTYSTTGLHALDSISSTSMDEIQNKPLYIPSKVTNSSNPIYFPTSQRFSIVLSIILYKYFQYLYRSLPCRDIVNIYRTTTYRWDNSFLTQAWRLDYHCSSKPYQRNYRQ